MDILPAPIEFCICCAVGPWRCNLAPVVQSLRARNWRKDSVYICWPAPAGRAEAADQRGDLGLPRPPASWLRDLLHHAEGQDGAPRPHRQPRESLDDVSLRAERPLIGVPFRVERQFSLTPLCQSWSTGQDDDGVPCRRECCCGRITRCSHRSCVSRITRARSNFVPACRASLVPAASSG